MKLSGRVWKIGADIKATDIVHARYDQFAMSRQYDECGKHVLEDVYPQLVREIQPGDLLVAGMSFGMGHAHYFGGAIMGGRAAGFAAFLADSISGIFQRVAIDFGMPALAFPGISEMVTTGDLLDFDLASGSAINVTTGETRQFKPVSQLILDIVGAGGSTNWALKRVGAEHAIPA